MQITDIVHSFTNGCMYLVYCICMSRKEFCSRLKEKPGFSWYEKESVRALKSPANGQRHRLCTHTEKEEGKREEEAFASCSV